MLSIYEIRGMEKGRKEGLQQGLTQGLRDGQRALVLGLLASKYGNTPDAVVARVGAMDEAGLTETARRILVAPTLAELGLLA